MGMVIGRDLYQIIKSSLGDEYYIFDEIGKYSINSHKRSYPVYSVINKNKLNNCDSLNLYNGAASSIMYCCFIVYFFQILYVSC
jgi:hypothetical protein